MSEALSFLRGQVVSERAQALLISFICVALFWTIYRTNILMPVGHSYPEMAASHTILQVLTWLQDGIAIRDYALSWYFNDAIDANQKYRYVSMPQFGFFLYYLVAVVFNDFSIFILRAVTLFLLFCELYVLHRILTKIGLSSISMIAALLVYCFFPVSVFSHIQFLWSDNFGQLIFLIFLNYIASYESSADQKYLSYGLLTVALGLGFDHFFISLSLVAMLSLAYFFQTQKMNRQVYLRHGFQFVGMATATGAVILFVHWLSFPEFFQQLMERFLARANLSNSGSIDYLHIFRDVVPWDFSWAFFPFSNIWVFCLLYGVLIFVAPLNRFLLFCALVPFFVYLVLFPELHYVHDIFLKYLLPAMAILVGLVADKALIFLEGRHILYRHHYRYIGAMVAVAFIAATSSAYTSSDRYTRFTVKNYRPEFSKISDTLAKSDPTIPAFATLPLFATGDAFLIGAAAKRSVYEVRGENEIEAKENVLAYFPYLEKFLIVLNCPEVIPSNAVRVEAAQNICVFAVSNSRAQKR
jgi:hypothetical protein